MGGVTLGWETSLVQPWRQHWSLTWSAWTVLTGQTRTSLIRTARKLTKKVGPAVVIVSPGLPTTLRPVGTRIGKGKGKIDSTRGWLPRGGTFLHHRGNFPGGWEVLRKRSPRGAARILSRGW